MKPSKREFFRFYPFSAFFRNDFRIVVNRMQFLSAVPGWEGGAGGLLPRILDIGVPRRFLNPDPI